MDNIAALKLRRFQYLHHLHETTEGDQLKTVNARELGTELGFSDNEIDRIVDYLQHEHLLEIVTLGPTVSITHEGIVEIENAFSHPDRPTKYFPPAADAFPEQQLTAHPLSAPAPKTPTAFISYSWDSDDHRLWVKQLATRLRQDGVDLKLDQWELAPGDQLPAFMERAVRENDFVLIVCTPRYRQRSDARAGGVGYEGDIMTGEVLTAGQNRKFIPILRQAQWNEASPSWLRGKLYIDLRGEPYSESSYQELVMTLLGQRSKAPPVGVPHKVAHTAPLRSTHVEQSQGDAQAATFEPIRITGVIVEEVGTPRNDGTRGSALYAVPLRLSRRPPIEWAELFVEGWNHPPRFTTMHRPGIARVIGNRVILDGTTLEEVEKYHRDTLKLVLDKVNAEYVKVEEAKRANETSERARIEAHRSSAQEIAKRLQFD